jgi:hypothetical protein
MPTYYILRKANGDILTVEIKGRTHIAVWDSDAAVRRSKQANPELIVYVPARADRRLIGRRFPPLDAPFFLIDRQDPDLQTGQEIPSTEVFGETTLAQAA